MTESCEGDELREHKIVLTRYHAWQQQREQQQEAARYKKNPDEYRSKMEVMEAARLRLQER